MLLSLFSYTAPPAPCGYLPDQIWSLRYEFIAVASATDYQTRLLAGWRRFGRAFFRPQCPECTRCLSIRVPVATFRPDRSQRRAAKANAQVRLVIGEPEVTDEKLALYDRYHEHQADHKGWPERGPKDAADYRETFVDNPFPTEEWCYYQDDRLIGVGYVDVVPAGLSAIYFFYDPAVRDQGLGTFNVLQVLAETRRRRMPHVYLGYYVQGCRSLEYKARFMPNEILNGERWEPYLPVA